MGDGTGIEWTDATDNTVLGCNRKSPGCKPCYAELQGARIANFAWADIKAGRNPGRKAYYMEVMKYEETIDPDSGEVRRKYLPKWNGNVVLIDDAVGQWARKTKPRMIFTNSMSDLWHEKLTFEQIALVIAGYALGPQHIYQTLTKRPERALEWFAWMDKDPAERFYQAALMGGWSDEGAVALANYINGYSRWKKAPEDGNPLDGSVKRWPLPFLWFGTSAETQPYLEERGEILRQIPAAVRWLSLEPLLGPVDVEPYMDFLSWAVVGGQAWPGAEPMHPFWVRSIRNVCERYGVAFLFKQWGRWVPEGQGPLLTGKLRGMLPDGTRADDMASAQRPGHVFFQAVGKKKAGRLLDGRLYDGYPGR